MADLPLNHEQLIKEIDQLHDVLPKLGSPVVFSHNDLLFQNVIYDEKARQFSCVSLSVYCKCETRQENGKSY